MRSVFAISLLALTCACSQPASEGDQSPPDPATVAQHLTQPTTLEEAVGAYRATDKNGAVSIHTISADGTITVEVEGEEPITGQIRVEPGKLCYLIDENTDGRCWIQSEVDADGSWSSTADDGSVSFRIKRLS